MPLVGFKGFLGAFGWLDAGFPVGFPLGDFFGDLGVFGAAIDLVGLGDIG